MGKIRWWLAGAAGLLLVAGVVGLSPTSAAPALAQFNPEPQDCACSKGINVGTGNAVSILKHCMCGQLQCAVLSASGQLHCSR